ncbi:hypothetical protein CRYUN_Cryun12cG0114700 [Craigia yunnanensis]
MDHWLQRDQCSHIKKIINSFRETLDGRFCSVYKGKLEVGRLVAVKVLKLDTKGVISKLDARRTVGYIPQKCLAGTSAESWNVGSRYGRRKNIDVTADHSGEIYYPRWVYDLLQQGNSLVLHGVVTSQDNELAKKMIMRVVVHIDLSCT